MRPAGAKGPLTGPLAMQRPRCGADLAPVLRLRRSLSARTMRSHRESLSLPRRRLGQTENSGHSDSRRRDDVQCVCPSASRTASCASSRASESEPSRARSFASTGKRISSGSCRRSQYLPAIPPPSARHLQALLSVQRLREFGRPRRQRHSIPNALEVLALIPQRCLGRLEITGEKLDVRPAAPQKTATAANAPSSVSSCSASSMSSRAAANSPSWAWRPPRNGRMDACPNMPIVSSALSSAQRDIPSGTGVGPQ